MNEVEGGLSAVESGSVVDEEDEDEDEDEEGGAPDVTRDLSNDIAASPTSAYICSGSEMVASVIV